jgi:hypothetical protein
MNDVYDTRRREEFAAEGPLRAGASRATRGRVDSSRCSMRCSRLAGERCNGVDCGVDSTHFPAAFTPKPTGQIARIVYVIRDFAGLEGDTLTV